jgi:hypothetical protein
MVVANSAAAEAARASLAAVFVREPFLVNVFMMYLLFS